jgi:hypothetical protein
MDEGRSQAGEGMNHEQKRSPDDVRAEIEQTRAELGDTVEALVAKTDVKGQAKQAVSDARTTVSDKVAKAMHTVSAKNDEAMTAAQQATPDSAGDAGRRVSRLLQENRVTVVPAATLVLGVLIGRRRAR